MDENKRDTKLREQMDRIEAIDPTALNQFCAEVLRVDSPPAPEYRIMQTME